MSQKWKQVAKAAQIAYNRLSRIKIYSHQDFHLITSKKYSKERKLLQKICENFPGADITLHLAHYRNEISPDDRNLSFIIRICKTVFNNKLYYRNIKISYYPTEKEVWVSFRTVAEDFRIHAFTYKSVKDFNRVAKDVMENISNIEFVAYTNY